MSVQRYAVQLQARRRTGASILHECPCGGIVSLQRHYGFDSIFLDTRQHISVLISA